MLNPHDIAQVLDGRTIEPSLAAELKELFLQSSGQPMRKRRSGKGLSTNTERLRLYNVVSALEDLHKLGYRIRTTRGVESRHLQALVEHWVKRGLNPKTMDNKLSYFRWYCSAIGKDGMLMELEDYLPAGTVVNRSRIATKDKTFSGNNIDPAKVIQDAMEIEQRVGYILLIMLTFGMRVAEASKMKIQARLEEALQTAKLVVSHGAKNGRVRELPLENWQQLDILVAALSLVDGPNGSLIPYGKQWDSWRKHLYRQVHKVGLKRDGENVLGLTPHSFRHENLNDLFYRVTGKPSPIHGGTGFDPVLYEKAMIEVTKRAGHNDKYKAGAYLSTPRTMAKQEIGMAAIKNHPLKVANEVSAT